MFAVRERVDPAAAKHDSGAWQGSLFAISEPMIDPEFTGLTRRQLDAYSWVDFVPNWLGGADELFEELRTITPWQTRQVLMYDRVVREPRLSSWWSVAAVQEFPIDAFREIRVVLSERYNREFDSIGCNYYRHGSDSVAWHGDRLPGNPREPIVAIVSTGSRRPFLLRPTGGGKSIRFELGSGDLLVMGGRSQVDWQHCVPKIARSGPRISVTYRHGAPTP